ncbi:MAG TPA: hypothetical protein VJB14_00035 [Planctomycetota bacterium]|nr:hypothetical protein [Planctomycetota bacterium]
MTLCLAMMMLLTQDELPIALSLGGPAPAGVVPDDRFLLRATGGVWSARSFDFDATTTASLQLRSSEETLLTAGVDAGMALYDRVFLFGTLEGAWANDIHAEVAGLSVGYRDGSDPGASPGVPQEAMIYAGALFGRFAITTPGFGDFENALGGRAGMSFTWKLARTLGLTLAVEYRYLKFDYKDDSTLLTGNESIGGSGIWAGLGLDLRF